MKTFILGFLLAVSLHSVAQKQARVILHLQSADTLVHKSIVNQIGNLKKAMPETEIELVCHGPGIDFLLKSNGRYATKIERMGLKNVSMVGCEFTMQSRNYKKEDLVPFAATVPLGIAEIVKKESEGWLYLKLGF